MLHRLGIILLVYAAAVAETAAGGTAAIAGDGATLGWLYLAAAVAAWSFGPGECAAWGAAIGLLCDATSGGPMGLEMTGMATITLIASIVRTRYEWRSAPVFTFLAAAVAAAAMCWVSAGTALVAHGRLAAPDGIRIAADAVATGISGLVLLLVWRSIRGGTLRMAGAPTVIRRSGL